jgi:hypothetical protein
LHRQTSFQFALVLGLAISISVDPMYH